MASLSFLRNLGAMLALAVCGWVAPCAAQEGARVTDADMVSATLSTFDILTVGVDGSGLRRISPPHNAAAKFVPGWGDNGKLIFARLDLAARAMAPVTYDPSTGSRTPVSIAGEGSYVQSIPSGR